MTRALWAWAVAATLTSGGCTCTSAEETSGDAFSRENSQANRESGSRTTSSADAPTPNSPRIPSPPRLAAATTHACAIGVNGSIECFGDETDGKTTAPQGRFKAIAAIDRGAYGLTEGGELVAWGAATIPAVAAGTYDAIACYSLGDTCCVHRRLEPPRCWGTFAPSFDDEEVEVFSPFAGEACWIESGGALFCRDGLRGATQRADGRFRDVSRGTSGLCAVTTDGSLRCWSAAKELEGPPDLRREEHFVAVSSGGDGSCALRDDGMLHCWGAAWARAPIDGRYREVACAGTYCCVLSNDGAVGCFGDSASPVVRARPLR